MSQGYPGAYTRASCYLGWVADTFGLKADFSLAGGHGSCNATAATLWHKAFLDTPVGQKMRGSGPE